MKTELRQSILGKDPVNAVALDPRSTEVQLIEEQARLKALEIESIDPASALPAVVKWRAEEVGGYSWKIEGEDYLSELYYGSALPKIGTKALDEDGTGFVVTDHEAGLTIRAVDLITREQFDPRRIYSSKGGNNVVFKRIDSSTGKPVIWSFSQSAEIVTGPNTELTRTDNVAKPTAASHLKMTQKSLAAYLIAQNPEIRKEELTKALKEAFPSARIAEDGRHGAHYLSLSRTGKLPEATPDDPRLWKR